MPAHPARQYDEGHAAVAPHDEDNPVPATPVPLLGDAVARASLRPELLGNAGLFVSFRHPAFFRETLAEFLMIPAY